MAAYDALYTSPYTDVWSFTVDATPPAAPTLISPTNGATISGTTPTLIWEVSPSPDVAGYLLDWSGVVSDVGAVTRYTFTSVLADGAYTWTVAAYDIVHNTSPYTDVWTLTVDTSLPTYLPLVLRDYP
jgi:hypothetical protein